MGVIDRVRDYVRRRPDPESGGSDEHVATDTVRAPSGPPSPAAAPVQARGAWRHSAPIGLTVAPGRLQPGRSASFTRQLSTRRPPLVLRSLDHGVVHEMGGVVDDIASLHPVDTSAHRGGEALPAIPARPGHRRPAVRVDRAVVAPTPTPAPDPPGSPFEPASVEAELDPESGPPGAVVEGAPPTGPTGPIPQPDVSIRDVPRATVGDPSSGVDRSPSPRRIATPPVPLVSDPGRRLTSSMTDHVVDVETVDEPAVVPVQWKRGVESAGSRADQPSIGDIGDEPVAAGTVAIGDEPVAVGTRSDDVGDSTPGSTDTATSPGPAVDRSPGPGPASSPERLVDRSQTAPVVPGPVPDHSPYPEKSRPPLLDLAGGRLGPEPPRPSGPSTPDAQVVSRSTPTPGQIGEPPGPTGESVVPSDPGLDPSVSASHDPSPAPPEGSPVDPWPWSEEPAVDPAVPVAPISGRSRPRSEDPRTTTSTPKGVPRRAPIGPPTASEPVALRSIDPPSRTSDRPALGRLVGAPRSTSDEPDRRPAPTSGLDRFLDLARSAPDSDGRPGSPGPLDSPPRFAPHPPPGFAPHPPPGFAPGSPAAVSGVRADGSISPGVGWPSSVDLPVSAGFETPPGDVTIDRHVAEAPSSAVGIAEPIVQRAVADSATASTEPAPSPSASADELVDEVYQRVQRRLRTDMRLEQERKGRLSNGW